MRTFQGRKCLDIYVTYRYWVSGQEFTSDDVSIGSRPFNRRENATVAAAKYEATESVTVYYDPSDPSVSLLEPGVGFAPYLGLFIGAGMLYWFGMNVYQIMKMAVGPE